MNIQRLTTKHVPDLINLHEGNLQGLSTALGTSYLHTYYQTICSDVKRNFIFGMVEDNTIHGFIGATSNPHHMMHILSPRFSIRLIWSIMKSLMKHQITFMQIFTRLRFNKVLESTIPRNNFYILVLIVEDKYRKHHIATDLLKHIQTVFPGTIWVDTKKNNVPAYMFYRNNGFSVEKSLDDCVLFKKTPYL